MIPSLSRALAPAGLTPLMLAASRGRLECVEVLLHAQSDPRAQLVAVEWEGATALHCAAMNGHVDCVRLLLQVGVCVSGACCRYLAAPSLQSSENLAGQHEGRNSQNSILGRAA